MVRDGLPSEPMRKIQVMVNRSRRSSSVRFPVGFVRQQVTGERPPLAKLMRDSEVRLKLYLSLAMLATKKPYEIDDLPSAAWLADMLNLPDAERNGARRVASALRWLHAEGFILRKPRPGHTPHLTILQPGSESAAGGRYVQVPLDIWREGWILTLSCRALAIYIVLREATGGRHGSAVIPGSRKAQYDLSDEIWAKAAAELTAVGLLEVREVFEKSSQRNEFESARRRLRYTLSPDDLLGQDGKNAGATASRTAARNAVRPAAQRGHAPRGRA